MRIKEVSDKLNVSARAIRYYEEQGLLSPAKDRDTRYRSFTENEIWRLQTILALREAGMPVDEIKNWLAGGGSVGAAEELRGYLETQRAVLVSGWVETKRMIETADRMLEMLDDHGASLPVEGLFRLAEESRKLREQRKSWLDRWNYDRLADVHDESVGAEAGPYADYGLALELVADWISPLPGEKGIDLGTGTGNLAAKLMERGARMAGVDQSAGMLKRCREKLPALETKLGNLLAVPYVGGTFDFVVSSFAFRHLGSEQQTLALEEMRRVLKPSGRICIAELMSCGTSDFVSDDKTAGRPPGEEKSASEAGYPSLEHTLNWFEERGYVTRSKRVNERLHLVYAVPIRK